MGPEPTTLGGFRIDNVWPTVADTVFAARDCAVFTTNLKLGSGQIVDVALLQVQVFSGILTSRH